MKITLKQLEVFIAIAKRNNGREAAEVLHLSQSACSVSLATLEKQLGTILFDRHGKQLSLNEMGRFLLPKALNLLTYAREFQELGSGHLIIGASSTIGNYLLPAIIGDWIQQNPRSKITLRVDNTANIIQQVLEFEVDIGLIEGNCWAESIEIIPWRQDELVIVAGPAHPLCQKKKLSMKDLHANQWILREVGSGTRDHFEKMIGANVIPFLELGNTEAIKNAVQKNLGISCVSKLTVINELTSGRLIELKTNLPRLKRNLYLLINKEKYRTHIFQRFIEMMI